MKNYNIIAIFILSIVFSACSKDFLEITPEDQITVDNYYNTDQQLYTGGASLYNRPWFHFNEKFILCMDVYAGDASGNYSFIKQFEDFAVNGENTFLNEGYRSLWNVVAFSNNLLNIVENKCGADVSDEAKEFSKGEALFMRSIAYFYLVRTWGAVPIFEKIDQYGTDVPVYRNRVEDVYSLIIRDLKSAAELLPVSWDANKGRVTKGSANAILAEVYLTLEDYSNAKTYADLVVNSGQYALMPNYGDIFHPANNNCIESIFELQWVAPAQGSHWFYTNTHQAYLAAAGKITGAGDGWGTFLPSLDFINSYEDGDLRKHSTIMEVGDFYPELCTADGGFTVENSLTSNSAGYRKYVVGSTDEWPTVNFMNTDLNTHIMRYAELLLIRAEAILAGSASTTDPTALADVNAVRDRAGLAPVSEVTLDVILQERRMELAIEGDRWYDLVRIERSKAVEMISSMNRAYLADRDDPTSGYASDKYVTPSATDFILPFPQGDADKNPLLREEPVAYDFSN